MQNTSTQPKAERPAEVANRFTKTRKTFKVQMFRGDMGSFTTNANSWEDLLCHVNSARDHDGLGHLTLEQLKNCQPKITRI